jgi:hypothetical protein
MFDPTNAHEADLVSQALLFLSGEMSDTEAAAFEESLAGNEAHQDALVAAVGLWPGLSEQRPDPRYRQRVVARLRRSQRPRVVVLSNGRERRRPFVWALAGGLAAALLVTIINPARWFTPAPGPTIILKEQAEPAGSETATEVIYSDLSNTDRLNRVRSEQEQRRLKHEDLKVHHPLLPPMAPGNNKSMM